MISSSPGKVIIFGEHSVVYGKHAVVTAINKRCYVKAEKSDEITIISEFGKSKLDFRGEHAFISYSIKRFLEIHDFKGVTIRVSSDIPPASGLGSSAAVTVATISALNAEFNTNLSKDEIYEIARKVELDVQGRGSGTDPYISTFGGTWLIPEREKLTCNISSLYVINTGRKSITADMVENVAKMRERFPKIFDEIFNVMDCIATEGRRMIENGDLEGLERLFMINQRMLSAINVSNPEIDLMVSKLENNGIATKITGAGGGGCLISIKKPIGLEFFEVKLDEEGVRIEDEDTENWRFSDN